MSTTLALILLAVLIICVVGYFLFFWKKDSGDLTDDERAILKARIFDRFEIKGFESGLLFPRSTRPPVLEQRRVGFCNCVVGGFTARLQL